MDGFSPKGSYGVIIELIRPVGSPTRLVRPKGVVNGSVVSVTYVRISVCAVWERD